MSKEKGGKSNKATLNGSVILKTVGAVLPVVILVVAAAFVIGERTRTVKTTETAMSADFDIGAASVKSVVPYTGGAAAIADSAVYYFDASGNLLSKNEHTFASPVADASGRNLILYDLGGYKYRIEKRGGVYSEHETASAITCAAIGKRGNYAYSLNSDGGYQSHLYVCSGRDKKIFEWGSSSDYISALTLSDNGRYCAAGILTSENAKIVSVVKLFEFNSDEPVLTVDFSGSIVFNVSFVSSKKLIVFCNDGVYFVDSTGAKEQILSYSSNEIKHFYDFPSGMKVLSLAVYGNENNTRVTVLNKRGKQLFEKTFSEEISDVVCSGSRVSVVLRDRIESFDKYGNSVGLVYLQENATAVALSHSRLYVLTSGGLCSFSSNLRGASEEESSTESSEKETASEEQAVSDESAAADKTANETRLTVTAESVAAAG